MSGMDSFDGYLEHIKAAILQIPFIKTFGVYPEIPAGFETPAAFLEIEDWSPGSEHVAGAKMSIELSCNIYLLREFAAEQHELKAQNAALFMSDWIDGRMFGPMTRPAAFSGAVPCDWIKNGKSVGSHSVQCVSFSQIIGVGVDPFDYPTQGILKQVYVGVAPDIGAEHESDYYGPIGR
ncbi:hypothetical protein LL061_08645 [Escherichia coli]|uniref:hypothetical protein n=1 Tax=Escherichia coli TaxID=562 RepID=UPI001D17FCDA|nr:hypothetical protein [Escherichia coli]MCC4040356.1 hypothetical protein [Escherichia coli]